jgi:dynein heavy chain
MEPADSAELKALEDFFLRAMDTLAALLDEYQLNIHERLSFLLERGHKCSRDDLLLLHTVCNWPQNIKNFVARSSELQRSRKRDLEMVVEGQQEQLSREIQSIARRIEKIAEAGSLAVADVQACVSRISLLKDSIAAAEIEAEALAEQEELLDMVALHSGAQVEALKRSLAPLDRLWTSARAFTGSLHMWLDAPMTELDPEEAEHSVDEMLRTVQMVQRDIKAQLLQEETDISNSLNLSRDVASQLVSEILDFTATRIPLMQLVCTPGLHERHWLGIQAATGISLPFSPSISLRDVVDVGLHKHCHSIEEICAGARQEYQIEKVLDAMEAEWAPIQLQTKAYRSTGTYVLSSVEDIQQLLDDHLVKIQAIKGSHHAEPFAQRAGVWEVTLTGLQDILDNWLRVQNAWLYLEPIFSSDDIMRQMPVEGRLFKAVDSIWRENMSMLVTDPGALETARRPGLLSALECANEKLETIQKGLNAYLETKRLAFSRFFFLSNDELLEILAETKDPLRVQPHLRKCFDGIASLDFSETLDILGCRDASGESVPFLYDALQSEPINPLATGGNVEVWLGQVETMMRKAVARAIDDSVADRAASVRMEWVHRWQGQVVLVVNQIHWTGRVEDALSNGQSSSPLAVELQKELLETVELVRTDIPKSLRIALGAAVVMDVHNRDVTAALGEQNVKSVSDFDWLAQLRYYWRLGSHSAMSGNPGTISCQMINAEQLYCFEYLGNNGRLVITPLTDRCYRTLMGAMQLHLGGAPEGPAGTGKTETTKDLGKAVAIQCVVTNCSDGLDYLAMGKFFKGLASSGAWACFDEFNRIQLEVLSVVAQQVRHRLSLDFLWP